MHRKFQMDRSGAKGQQSLLQSLFGPITHIPDPPPLPENPIPFGAAVFDPMTESWYTTQFDPFDDSDIDNTETPAKLPDLLNATQTAMDGSALKNITTSTTDLLRHHLPILAKVVSKLFQGQDESQKQDQPSQLRLNVAANAHGYLTKSLEPSDTRAVRRGPTDKQSQESPSVPYFEQDIDPAPDAEAAIQIPEHSTLTQGTPSTPNLITQSIQTSLFALRACTLIDLQVCLDRRSFGCGQGGGNLHADKYHTSWLAHGQSYSSPGNCCSLWGHRRIDSLVHHHEEKEGRVITNLR